MGSMSYTELKSGARGSVSDSKGLEEAVEAWEGVDGRFFGEGERVVWTRQPPASISPGSVSVSSSLAAQLCKTCGNSNTLTKGQHRLKHNT